MGQIRKRGGVWSPMIAAIYAPKSIDQTGVSDHQQSVARLIEHHTRMIEEREKSAGEPKRR